MKRNHKIFAGRISYTPGFRFDELEFDPQEELAAVRKEHRRAAIKQCRFEELCTKHILKQAREVMRNQAERQYLARELAKAEEQGRQLRREFARAIVAEERKEFARRGVLKGRRR